jgi:hypothetical protein
MAFGLALFPGAVLGIEVFLTTIAMLYDSTASYSFTAG